MLRTKLLMASAGLDVLRPSRRLILDTGSAIVGGRDRLKMALHALAGDRHDAFRYREIDPDMLARTWTILDMKMSIGSPGWSRFTTGIEPMGRPPKFPALRLRVTSEVDGNLSACVPYRISDKMENSPLGRV